MGNTAGKLAGRRAINPEEENIPKTEDAFAQAQTPVKYNPSVYVTLRKPLSIKLPWNERLYIENCIKMGKTLVFADHYEKQLITCHVDCTDIYRFPLPYKPYYLTDVDGNTVAVSCQFDRIILIINISTGDVTSTIQTGRNVLHDHCYGISYYDDKLYVGINNNKIHVMNLTGKVIHTLALLPDTRRFDLTGSICVDRNRLIHTELSSIYCFTLDGKKIWEFKSDTHHSLSRATTDDDGNVYATDYKTHTVIVVSADGKHLRELLTKTDGLNTPYGIYFDRLENILLVGNLNDGKAFLFDIKKKCIGK